MPTVELIYDMDCPNVDQARGQIRKALTTVGLEEAWSEWRIGDTGNPVHVCQYGSPTVLVDGRDVDRSDADSNPASCRVYAGKDGALSGVPAVTNIVMLLEAGGVAQSMAGSTSRWGTTLGVVPGIAAGFLPKVACPACWPAYAGALSSLGLGFLLDTTWLLPLTAFFLAIAVGALAFRARRRRGYVPFSVGLTASAITLIGKFVLDSDPTMYVGLAMLVAASVWNTWPIKSTVACPSCDSAAQNPQTI